MKLTTVEICMVQNKHAKHGPNFKNAINAEHNFFCDQNWLFIDSKNQFLNLKMNSRILIKITRYFYTPKIQSQK